MKKIISFIIILFSSTIYLLGQSEILINRTQDNAQTEPVLSVIDSSENIAIVWVSYGQADLNSETDIYMRKFNKDLSPIGDELLINDSQIGLQEKPQIASNQNGNYVVVWTSFEREDSENFFDIKAKVFQHNGLISEEILVNSYQPHTQNRPQVDMNNKGEFIVVWESWYQDGSDRGIYAQYFNNDGSKNGNEFLVNTSTSYSQCKASVSFFYDNKFIIVWESWDEAEIGYNLYAKIFDENLNVVLDEFLVNNHMDNYQWYSDVTTYSDNSFDIVWCSWEQDGSDGGIYLKSFNKDYNQVSEEVLVNSSTKYYQWLPKISKLNNNRKAVIWSSWNIDGSREGVYYKLLDDLNREVSLETRLNNYTDSYQWQSEMVNLSSGELVGVWSSWGQFDKDYDIIAKKIEPSYLVGSIDSTTFKHINGKSSSKYIVHVVDSSKLNGHSYEITFSNYEDNYLSFSVTDMNKNELKVSNIPLNFGEDVKYLSEQFDGVVVEIIPNFNLNIDLSKSIFVNNSGSNLNFNISESSIFPALAPVDMALIWGSTDTLANGEYKTILDTALSPSNIKEILIPFEVRDIVNGERAEVLVFENNSSKNNRWDAGEDIYILTPDEYKSSDLNTHVHILANNNSDEIILPTLNDTIFIITKKPITVDDTYQFSTNLYDVILDIEDESISNNFELFQNYPNPFNPTTTIKYQLPTKVKSETANVKLIIYDILGREIATLVNQKQNPGNYEITWDAGNLSSGVYFFAIKYGQFYQAKKMMVVK